MEPSTRSPQECRACLYTSDHPFGLRFDSTGLCTGCITHQEKSSLDWPARFQLLEERVSEIRKRSRNSYYDCVVPVRGTPEYFYVLDVVKARLGLNPLIVSYNSQFNSLTGIRNIARIRETFDVDILTHTPNQIVYKKLIRESLARMGNMRWPFLAGETVFPVQVAVERSIPLVIWPYHQPTEQVGMHSYLEEPEMSRRDREAFDLMGMEPESFVLPETIINSRNIWDLRYPKDAALDGSGVRGIYLANYLPWDSRRYSEEMIAQRGALSALNPRTFDTYDRVDDMTYMSVHDLLKFGALGYSRVTDNLTREIRFGRIDRATAQRLADAYACHDPGKVLDVFMRWLGLGTEGLEWLFARQRHAQRELSATPKIDSSAQSFVESFISTSGDVAGDEFIVFGKGLELDEVL